MHLCDTFYQAGYQNYSCGSAIFILYENRMDCEVDRYLDTQKID